LIQLHFSPSVRVRALRGLATIVIAGLILNQGHVAVGHPGHDERMVQLLAELAAHPEDVSLHLALAEENLRHGDGPAALRSLVQVETLAPGRFQTELPRARALLSIGNSAAARQVLDRLVGQNPENLRAVVLRGRIRLHIGETEAALADFRTALAATDFPEPDLVREAADALAAAGRVEDALATLDAAMKRIGQVPSLILRALELECSGGRFEAALALVDVAQRDAPRPEPWMERRAVVLASAGRLQESRAAWQTLREHLAALPAPDRGSHAMSALLERTVRALAALDSETVPANRAEYSREP
jgi:tetratricopeptide (TPR) repeat protein